MLFVEHNRGKKVALYTLVGVAFLAIIWQWGRFEPFNDVQVDEADGIVSLFNSDSDAGSRILARLEFTRAELTGFKEDIEKQVKQLALVATAKQKIEEINLENQDSESEEEVTE